MKVGICTSLEKAPLAVDAGFDYVELSVAEMTMREPWDTTPYAGLPVEAANLFFPGGVKLFPVDRSDGIDVLEYLRKARPRISEIGVQVGVVGSGNQRRCPPELTFPMVSDDPFWNGAENAEEILARYLAEGMKMPGTTVFAPESLERSETNVGGDCASFSRILAKYGVGYTADAYHLLKEWDANGREGGKDIPTKAYWEDQMPHAPTHLHLAQLEGRRFPHPGDPMLEGFFARLRELGYDARVSLECNSFEPGDYKTAIANLKTYFA